MMKSLPPSKTRYELKKNEEKFLLLVLKAGKIIDKNVKY